LKDSSGKYAMERAEMAKHLEVRDIIWSAFEMEWEENERGNENAEFQATFGCGDILSPPQPTERFENLKIEN
jgi:hypothetical protein